MRRIFLLCVIYFCLFLILPTNVHGEYTGSSSKPPDGEEEGESRKGLFGTLKKVNSFLKEETGSISVILPEAVNTIEEEVKDLFEHAENEPVTSKIETTMSLLNETVIIPAPTIEKTTGTVTSIAVKTTSEVTSVVNETVNSVLHELPTVPVVNPVVKFVSGTVNERTTSVETVAETTEKLVNQTLKSTIDVSKDAFIAPVETVDSSEKANNHQQENHNDFEKTISEKEKLFLNLNEHSLDIDSTPGLDKELIVLEKPTVSIELIVNSKTVVLEKKTFNESDFPTETSEKRDVIPAASITKFPSPTASITLTTGGQADVNIWGIIDVFSIISSSRSKWIQTNEVAMIPWPHAPPGKPPQQSPLINVK